MLGGMGELGQRVCFHTVWPYVLSNTWSRHAMVAVMTERSLNHSGYTYQKQERTCVVLPRYALVVCDCLTHQRVGRHVPSFRLCWLSSFLLTNRKLSIFQKQNSWASVFCKWRFKNNCHWCIAASVRNTNINWLVTDDSTWDESTIHWFNSMAVTFISSVNVYNALT